MEIYDTEYKNLTYKELFTMLEGLKNTVLNSYDEELFFNEYSTKHDDFHNILCVYKKVLQEFHNRICDEMSTKLGTTIYPTNVAIRYTDMKNTITNNGKISLGEYDHREDVVYINLLVNPVKANNFQFKKFVNNWTMEMLNTLFTKLSTIFNKVVLLIQLLNLMKQTLLKHIWKQTYFAITKVPIHITNISVIC